MREVVVVLTGIALFVIALTVIGGGTFSVGTSRSGPYANFGYTGPY